MKYIFHGRVQAVGFRYFTYRTAKKLGVKGTVKNLPDGTVELIVNDDSPNIDKLIERIKEGNGHIRVDKIEQYEHESNKQDFKIVY
jgi:acylphosphatase